MIQCILFDLDGTLVDAKDWHYEALNCALEQHGYEAIPYDVHLKSFDGRPTRVKLEKLGIAGKEAAKVGRDKQFFTQKIIEERCREDLPLRRELARLWHMGYRMAVFSNAVRRSCDAMIYGLGITDYLVFWVSNEEVEKPKPDPEGWLASMQAFDVAPNETVIVEDSAVGIASAKASGAHVYPVQSPRDVQCDAILEFIGEIERVEYRNADSRSRATI